MLKILAFIVNIFLIAIIFLRVPKESMGFGKGNVLGSPASVERFLCIGTAVGILVYFIIALQFNLSTN